MKHTGFKVVVIVFLALVVLGLAGNLYIAYRRWQLDQQLLQAQVDLEQGQIDLKAAIGDVKSIAQQERDDRLAREAADSERRAAILKGIAALDKQMQPAIESLLDDYNHEAYSSGLDRIAEQQLTAAEYTLRGLQLLLQQNQLLLQLTAGK